MEMSGVRNLSQVVRKVTCQNREMTVPARMGLSGCLLSYEVHVCGQQFGTWVNQVHWLGWEQPKPLHTSSADRRAYLTFCESLPFTLRDCGKNEFWSSESNQQQTLNTEHEGTCNHRPPPRPRHSSHRAQKPTPQCNYFIPSSLKSRTSVSLRQNCTHRLSDSPGACK